MTPEPLAFTQTGRMRRLMYVHASAFAGLACVTSVVIAGGGVPATEKDNALALSAAPATSPPRTIAKMRILKYEPPYRSTPLAALHGESPTQERVPVLRTDAPAMQLRDKNELRYHYATGSSIAMTARPHHVAFAWRAHF